MFINNKKPMSNTFYNSGQPPQDKSNTYITAAKGLLVVGDAVITGKLETPKILSIESDINTLAANEVILAETQSQQAAVQSQQATEIAALQAGSGTNKFLSTPVIFKTIDDMLPNAIIPTGTAPGDNIVKTFDLGRKITAGWVSFTLDFVYAQNSLSSEQNTFDSTIRFLFQNFPTNEQTMLYVTEDYSKTVRYSSFGSERTPDAISIVSNTSPLRKTYTDLGGFMFGVAYKSISGDSLPFAFSSYSYNPGMQAAEPYYLEAVYFDNSGATTLLTFVFKVKDITTVNIIFNDKNAILVYPNS
jgi:hypothetical protein